MITERDREAARRVLRRRATEGTYEGDETAIAGEIAGARMLERIELADQLDVLSIHHLETENKFARHGAYDSAAELVAWKHGVRAAAEFLRTPQAKETDK